MLRARLGLLVVLPVIVSSCAFSGGGDTGDPGDPGDTSGTSQEAEPTPEEPSTATPAPEPQSESAVPAGTFATLDALCEDQKRLAAPRLEQAAKDRAERTEGEAKLVARCEVSGTALAAAKIELRAPFLEVRAIEVETGHATETHVVARTQAGWVAVPHASVDSWYDDPGCFSIERDTGIVAVRVEGDRTPVLVVVEGTDRGAHMEEVEPEAAGEPHEPIYWMDVSHRARACRLQPSGLACDEPVVVRVQRVKSVHGRTVETEARFETTTTVSPEGRVLAARTFDPEAPTDD
jgi:hypothetical protein